MLTASDTTLAAPLKQRYEQIADRLATEIRVGTLPEGTRLPAEREVAARMDVGRASVREALAALQVRGLVETRPGAGSFVAADALARIAAEAGAPGAGAADVSPSALLEARLAVEPQLARLAAERRGAQGVAQDVAGLLAVMAASTDAADPVARRRWSDADRRFHRSVAVAAGNPVLLALADHVAALMDEPLWRRLRDEAIAVPGLTDLQLAEHRLIWAAIGDGDAEAAAQHATQHIHRARRTMALD